MNHNYKRLMKQHGGYIPFSILGGVKKRKQTKKRIRKKTRILTRKIRKPKLPQPNKYMVGTILRKNKQLYKLNQLKRWIKI